jgi:hypothetical protein
MGRIETLVRDFESGELPPAEFHHAQHLTVALFYVTRLPFDDAAVTFREGVRRYLGVHSVDPSKYHETITMFWLRVVEEFVACSEPAGDLDAAADRLVAEWGDSKAIGGFYSREVLDSELARTTFVEPDLKPIPTRDGSR